MIKEISFIVISILSIGAFSVLSESNETSCINGITAYQNEGMGGTSPEYLATMKEEDNTLLITHKAFDEVAGYVCKVLDNEVQIQEVNIWGSYYLKRVRIGEGYKYKYLNVFNTKLADGKRLVIHANKKFKTYSANGERVVVTYTDLVEQILNNIENKTSYSRLNAFNDPVDAGNSIMIIAGGYREDSNVGNIPVQIEITYNKRTKGTSIREQ